MDLAPLLQTGAVGIVLLWFMIRAERLLTELTKSVNRLALASALEVATRDNAPEVIREQAKAIITGIKRSSSFPAVGDV